MAEIETHRKKAIRVRLADRDDRGGREEGKRKTAPCFWCEERFPVHSLTLDRLVPRSMGGTNGQTNLVLACRPCNNNRKHEEPEVMQKALDKLKANNEMRPWSARQPKHREMALADFVGRDFE